MIHYDMIHGDKFDMRYVVFGEGEKDLLILPGVSVLHVTEMGEAVARRYDALRADYRICLFDRIEEIPAGYSVEDMADDTADALRILGVKRTAVFGASQGGMVALALAIRHPEMVERMILASTSAKCRQNPSLEEVFAVWKKLSEEGDSAALYDSFLERVYSAPVAELLRKGTAPVYSEGDLRRFIGQLEAFWTVDLRDRLGDVKAPALLLAAEGDRVFGMPDYEVLKQDLKCESFCYGPEYGHGVYDEAPDFIGRMQAFLEARASR